ncbi:putative E3 ubiquitin-protein ligase XBAT31 isoform X1 [Punica granatum]|uniref:RING-type E3 ubiquitin transferase n=3 Tax=Punica granatum TaxID=22663 RepID=A0A6P8EAV4_PUNGR|nr:putative E3 ubiquitin-protein ligase XBAT31 isoform X1 [Punica granatum]
MGQGLSCWHGQGNGMLRAVKFGDLDAVEALLERYPTLSELSTVYGRQSVLHLAAASGHIEILSMLLNRSVNPDLLNRHKQTPLMLAAMHGNISCVSKLLEAGANVLMFDSVKGRTCLHHAAYYGHSHCLEAILSAAQSSPVSASWGYARFVNIRDGRGATPLHLAARQAHDRCVHILLENGALVCASTSRYGYPGSSPLHLAAQVGSLDCIRELLAWGADRLQRDSSGRIPYVVALKHKHNACAALLDPASAEPLVWPSPLKLISELNHEAKALLEKALMDANKEREKSILKGTLYSLPSPSRSEVGVDDDVSEASETDLCCICFDQLCSIEVQDCSHRMCAQCILSLCCHNKPNPTTSCLAPPICPFCRSSISGLVVAKVRVPEEPDHHDITEVSSSSKPRKSWKSQGLCEGSSSLKGLLVMGSFKMGGRLSAENEWIDKP